jgi:acetate kinase
MDVGHLLTVNGGSSSIRCAVFDVGHDANIKLKLNIKIDRIGNARNHIEVLQTDGMRTAHQINGGSRVDAINALINWLVTQPFCTSIKAIGHRVVHGMSHTQPQKITSQLLDELQQLGTLDPEHLPFEMELIRSFQDKFPVIPQVACFDTAFHRSMPAIARTLALPEQYRALGIERYGFHGLSYSYLLEELARVDNHAATRGRVIMAHLGNGASLAAVRAGICIDTSMSFTPASGIMMSTRSGDIDPGILYYISKASAIGVDELQRALNHDSGLLGISKLSGDIRDLLNAENDNVDAALAISMFCYQIRKYIGAYAAALGGLDTLIFSGGIGENSAVIRQRICDGLTFAGITLNHDSNAVNTSIISADNSTVKVHVIRTDEELMIARLALQAIAGKTYQ